MNYLKPFSRALSLWRSCGLPLVSIYFANWIIDLCADKGQARLRSVDLANKLAILESGLLEEQTAQRWTVWGTVHQAIGNVAAAEYGMRTALQFDPDYPIALEGLASLLIGRGRAEEARHAREFERPRPVDAGAARHLVERPGRLERDLSVVTAALSR